jgi:ribosomal protein S18 acetylase RimI-like enzyme
MAQLPVLKGAFAAGRDDLVRFFHKIELESARHLGEETQLDCGTAIVNPDLSRVNDANGVLDAAIPPGAAVDDVIAQVDEQFASASSMCRRWVMNPSAKAQETAPLAERLIARGFARRSLDILHLPRLPQTAVKEVGGLKIIPGRASFRHVRTLEEEGQARASEPQLADAAMMHLDDPHYEAIVALKNGEAVAVAAVLGVGELAGVQNLFVSQQYRRLGIGRTMMSRLLEICVRSLYRHILLSVAAENVAAQALYRELGFEKVGEFQELVLSDARAAGGVEGSYREG